MKSRSIIHVLIAVVLLAVATPALADNSGILDNTLSQFNVVAQDFGHKTSMFGKRLLMVLSTLQLSIMGIKFALKQVDISEIVGGITNSIFAICVFFMFIQNPAILHVPIDYFTSVGQAGSGLPTLTPSTLITQGIQLSGAMTSAFNDGVGNNGDMLAFMKNILPNLYLFTASLVVIASFAIIAFQMFLVLVQSYMWFCLTPVFVGFGGLKYTRDIAMSALKGGITIGAKILAVYFVAGLARGLAPIWATSMGDLTLTNWAPLYNVAIGAAGVAYLSLKIPALAGDMVNGTASMSASDVASTLVTAASAAAGAAGGIAGMSSLAKSAAGAAGGSGLAKALGAGSNAMQDMSAGGGLDAGLKGGAASSSNTPPPPPGGASSSPAAPSSSSPSGGASSSPAAPLSSSPAGKSSSSPAAPSSSSPSGGSSSSPAAPSSSSPSGEDASGNAPAENATPATEPAAQSGASSDSGTPTGNTDTPAASSSPLSTPVPSATGDASNASIGGGGSNDSAPDNKSSSQEALHKKIQNLQGYIPNDGGTVGLNANISHQTD